MAKQCVRNSVTIAPHHFLVAIQCITPSQTAAQTLASLETLSVAISANKGNQGNHKAIQPTSLWHTKSTLHTIPLNIQARKAKKIHMEGNSIGYV